MTIHQGERNSLSFLPATPLSRSQTLEGLFELTRHPSSTSTHLVHCFRNYRDTRTLSGVPRWVQRSQDTVKNVWQTLIVGLMKTHLFSLWPPLNVSREYSFGQVNNPSSWEEITVPIGYSDLGYSGRAGYSDLIPEGARTSVIT